MSLIEDLGRIGFTEYEARVYLALLRENPATGYQLSKSSGVPRSMVYESLRRLYSRGVALETVEGRATLYRPVPPDTLMDRHEQEHRHLVEALREGLGEQLHTRAEDRVWSVGSRSTALAYARQMVQNAHDELFLVMTDSDLEALRDEVRDASQRGISTHTLLTGQGELDCGQVARHPPLESEIQGLTGTLLVACDHEEVLIASTEQDTAATITRNRDLVLIARQFVWMELLTQRVYRRLGAELLDRLDPDDRRIFESLLPMEPHSP